VKLSVPTCSHFPQQGAPNVFQTGVKGVGGPDRKKKKKNEDSEQKKLAFPFNGGANETSQKWKTAFKENEGGTKTTRGEKKIVLTSLVGFPVGREFKKVNCKMKKEAVKGAGQKRQGDSPGSSPTTQRHAHRVQVGIKGRACHPEEAKKPWPKKELATIRAGHETHYPASRWG